MASWRLRAAMPGDREAAWTLLRETGLPTEGVDDNFPAGYIVAESGERPVAVAGLERYGSFGLLRSLAVSPAWRGRGIGKALTDRLLALAGAMGLEAVYLLTTTAQAYFTGMGFRCVDRKDAPAGIRESVEFAKACPESAVCMSRRLGP
jgi:amino-acid N-acetyltransferase